MASPLTNKYNRLPRKKAITFSLQELYIQIIAERKLSSWTINLDLIKRFIEAKPRNFLEMNEKLRICLENDWNLQILL